MVEAKLVSINVNKKGRWKKNSFDYGGKVQTKIQTYLNRRESEWTDMLFPFTNAVVSWRDGPGRTSTAWHITMLYGHIFQSLHVFRWLSDVIYIALCEMPENTGVQRQPCASPGFLPPGATRVCRDGEWSEKTRAEEQTCEGVKADLGRHWLALAPLSPLFLWLAITHRWPPRHRLATVLHLIRSATRTRRKNGKRTSWFNEGRKKEEPTCLIWCEKAQFFLVPTRTFWGQSVLHNVWQQELHTPWQNKSEVGPS